MDNPAAGRTRPVYDPSQGGHYGASALVNQTPFLALALALLACLLMM